ncbi:hypothetical protein JKL49_09295 [Phenylobacterium sp. 20VBR1]|uniref:Phosphotyrosine protein phosphatase I domain-containing protein n=1 Tax=Phenylobacterium glaciei TaxID=2803784 RepID=A0A941CZP9_9CAUL|nr:hypothetical protein [Phenylobacterium glaciei]MBR7619581.1 hypothetical protein [Phenylobacterium glaciei]
MILSPADVTRRTTVLALLLLARPAAAAQAKPCPPPRVLFVCPAGSVKSAIARETLKHAASRRGLAVVAQSRGVTPEDHASPVLAAHLRADGIDPAAEALRRLETGDSAQADIVIAFDEAAQAPGLERARAWDIPSWNSQYEGARAALAPKIEALLDEVAARSCTGA